ncbi:protein KASH5 isoform X2 [Lissotriton helveticus]
MEGCTSEELMLDCAFNACDFEGAGEVPVYRILEYLQNVTGKSLEEEGLCSLYRMLDPEERGVSLNLETFHTIMANWIAECRQEWVLEGTKEEDNLIESVYLQPCGMAVASSPPQLEGYGGDSQKCSLGEAADLMSSIENLEFTNKKLTDQNTKLQRSLELSDESVARLHEEIAQLKNDLKSTQTALQHAKSNVDELEDLKAVTKSLEERNGELQSRSRQLEKELQCLNIQLQMLRKENGNLLTERERERKKTEDLIAERTALKEQLCEYERFISQKDLLLSERMKQAEELKGTVEEYRAMTQELKVEITRLQERMSQTSGDLIRMSDDSSEIAPSILRFQLQSLCMEIEELDQGGCIDDGLPSPLVGVFPWSSFAAFTVEVLLVELCTEMRASDFWFATEELLTECQEGLMAVLQCLPPDQDNKNLQERLPATVKHLRKDLEEQSGIFQQRLGYLTDLKMTWEGYLYKLKVGLQRFKQLDKKEKTECIGSSTRHWTLSILASSTLQAASPLSSAHVRIALGLRLWNCMEQHRIVTSGGGGGSVWAGCCVSSCLAVLISLQIRQWLDYSPAASGSRIKQEVSQKRTENKNRDETANETAKPSGDWRRVKIEKEVLFPAFLEQESMGSQDVSAATRYLCNPRHCFDCLAFGVLLLLLLGILLLLLSVSQTGREHIWTAMKMTVWPHIQLRYISPEEGTSLSRNASGCSQEFGFYFKLMYTANIVHDAMIVHCKI